MRASINAVLLACLSASCAAILELEPGQPDPRSRDVNGDGYADVAIVVPSAGTDPGAVHVFFGGPRLAVGAPVGAPPDRTYAGPAGVRFGASVAIAGDVNGDGYAEVIVGAPTDGQGDKAEAGGAYVYFGSADDQLEAPPLRIGGERLADHLGFAVAAAGDVNRDGYADLVVGVPGVHTTGAALVVLGGPDGFLDPGTWLMGTQAGDDFGRSVASAGDMNRDGFDDIVVGAPGFDPDPEGLDDAGAALVFFGGPGRHFEPSPDRTLPGRFRLGASGWTVAPAGDVNGDGFADVIVGAPRSNDPVAGTDAGSADIFLGSADAALVRISVGTRRAAAPLDLFGFSVASAGDTNRDGFADVLVGAPGDDLGPEDDAGSVYLYFGQPDGALSDEASPVLSGMELAGHFGAVVASPGDVNADGFADVLVTSGYDGDSTRTTHLYFGGLGPPIETRPDRTFAGVTAR